ncbi:MAG: cell wall hydrolase [Betaproteobacteria bacterium]
MIGEIGLTCLAVAIYFEARGEPQIGQLGVAQVILNRVASDKFPDNICDVVMEGKRHKWNPNFPLRHKCQFSFFCDGLSDRPTHKDAFRWARAIARFALSEARRDITKGATFYHADYVTPPWSKYKIKTIKIGQHIFYKDK